MALRKDDILGRGAANYAADGRAESRLIDDRFELREVLGTGGMSTVYLAWDRQSGAACAVKVLAENLARHQEFRGRFRQEAAAASSLVHPRIVRVYAHGDAGTTLYIAMEYVGNGTLRGLLDHRGRLPEGLALRLAAEAADALAYAHERRVIHRDIKPHNILLTEDTHVKVADFGIARTVDETSCTKTGTVLGSTQYIAPEQARGERAGPASDQYSLGVVLYEALAGRLPFEETQTPVAMALKHINETPRDLRMVRPDVSDATAAVVQRLLAKSPEGRFTSTGELAAALRRIYARFGSEEAPTVVSPLFGETLASARAQGATVRLATAARRAGGVAETAPLPVLRGHRRRAGAAPQALLTMVALAGLCVFGSVAYHAYRAGALGSAAQRSNSSPVATVRAPSLIGKTLVDAQRLGAAQLLTVAVASSRQDPRAPAGVVVAQDPPSDAAIAARGTVHVVVSRGSGIAPSVRGSSLAAARDALAAAGLRVGSTQYANSDTVATGMVIDQSPGALTHLPFGAAVDLVISQGPSGASTSSPAQTAPAGVPAQQSPAPSGQSGSIVVPGVTGASLSQAESALHAAGLRTGPVGYAYDDHAAAGVVIGQEKGAGAYASANDSVALTVSKGPRPQPTQTPPPQNPPPQNPPSVTYPAPPQTPSPQNPPSEQYPAPPQAPPPDNSSAPTPP